MSLFSLSRSVARGAAIAAVFMAVVAAGFWVAPQPAEAARADDAFLARMDGQWRGNGRVRPSPTAGRERVSCRMDASWNASGKRLKMNMKCKGVDVEFSSSGFLVALSRPNVYEGQWRAGGGIGQASVAGRRRGNSLTLTLTSRDPKSGESVRSTVVIRLGNGRITNIVRSVDPDTNRRFEVLSLTLRKR